MNELWQSSEREGSMRFALLKRASAVRRIPKPPRPLGDDFKVEFPTGSGKVMTLWKVAGELSRRMTNIFLQDERGHRPVFGNLAQFQTDPHWRDLVLFYE
jgi:hypothetical protein